MKNADELLGSYRSWDELLAGNGPVEEPELCSMLGAGFLSQAQYRQAALQFARVSHFQPTNFFARIGFAKALAFGGWTDRGLAEIDKLEKDLPNLNPRFLAETAGVRAAAYYAQTNFARAEDVLKKAQETYPNDPAISDSLFELYRLAGRFTNALALLDRQIEKSPTNIVARLQKAELLLGREDFEGAHATLDLVLAAAPNNTAALLFHAFAFIQEKKYDDAMIRVDKVLMSDPNNAQALAYKGIVHMEQKNPEKAREAFDQALKKEPNNFSVLRNRAILNLRSERWEEAKGDYQALRRIAPKSHAVLYGLGEVAYHQKDYEAAKRYYENYLKNAPATGSAELEEEKKKVQARLREIGGAQK
jgi:tetratricopeptide (TPR) repeat protein